MCWLTLQYCPIPFDGIKLSWPLRYGNWGTDVMLQKCQHFKIVRAVKGAVNTFPTLYNFPYFSKTTETPSLRLWRKKTKDKQTTKKKTTILGRGLILVPNQYHPFFPRTESKAIRKNRSHITINGIIPHQWETFHPLLKIWKLNIEPYELAKGHISRGSSQWLLIH